MRILALLFFTILSAALNAAVFVVELDLPDGKLKEKDYRDALALYFTERGEEVYTEVKCDGGRCDILTSFRAIEVDRAEKWPEAIGQACHYALYFRRKATIAVFGAEKMSKKRRRAMVQTCQRRRIDLIYLTPKKGDFAENLAHFLHTKPATPLK